MVELLDKRGAANEASAPIAYFYCERNASEPQRADPDEVMRSLLKQLSCSKSDFPIKEPVVKMYRERQEEAEDDGCDPAKLTINECVELILAILDNSPATIIIDALDECDPNRRHEVLMALDEIIQKSANLIKVFVSSRDDNDIVCRLVYSPNVFIRASDNGEDIKLYVQSEVRQCIADKRLLGGNLSEDMKTRIINTLIRGSQGMYVI